MDSWMTDYPLTHSLDERKLNKYVERLSRLNTSALIVIRNDRVVKEWYADGVKPTDLHNTASLAKTIVGGMALALAVDAGYMEYDDLACQYIPEWKDNPQKSQITIRQLATHTSGIAEATRQTETGWDAMFWEKPNAGMPIIDPFTISLQHAPVLAPPGETFIYSNPGTAALCYAITASLRHSPYPDIYTLLREKLMQPLGIPDEEWSIGYGKAFELDGMRLHATWGGGRYSARAVAQIGRLLLRQGRWEDRTLISAAVLEPMAKGDWRFAKQPGFPQGHRLTPSVCANSNYFNVFPGIPDCMYLGSGAGHRLLVVVPSLNLAIIRLGGSMTLDRFDEVANWEAIRNFVCEPITGFLLNKSPYPPSDKVRDVRFADKSDIRIDGHDSDNWPCTWADDGDLYTSYGDGFGFVPHTDKKLSMGFAKVIGTPESFQGVNIRTETGERVGSGAKGEKVSGFVMVDGVLYLIARNAGNAQLGWSEDKGKTWEWGFRFTTSFSCPTFVNYGRNYAGAPDDYLYIYSPNGDSAYECYDTIVMARVHKNEARHQNAYEYYGGLDEQGAPVWTPSIEERGAVFAFPQHCHRLEAIYHAATERYWLVVACNHEGGWGIFDAPTPWGPWTTVYFTEYWGLGKTHSYRFPTKWISEDGTKLHLVFSGRMFKDIDYDAFCVREMTLASAPPYPQSSLVRSLTWAPPEETIRMALGLPLPKHPRGADGSDNWPVTWADDGSMYTTYGDGYGFDPILSEKLGLGFARIEGNPPDVTGINIRSVNAENRAHGRRGKKGHGILMVDGVLYLWLFHADEKGGQSQLAWSRDYAKTWTFADWKFEEFGLCAFINFGPNYAGARDEYVYTVTPDSPMACVPADRMILMRVPKNRIADRSGYEFFVRLKDGEPVWSPYVSERGAVFEHGDACLRSGISYNAALKRYFWWQHIPNDGVPNDRGETRFSGGFGIYDAPEPWGPWTTVYHTFQWDMGPGEQGEFPTKWMSEDGKTMHLVFSGDDNFCVRRAELEIT